MQTKNLDDSDGDSRSNKFDNNKLNDHIHYPEINLHHHFDNRVNHYKLTDQHNHNYN
jgi:hypothetical protein